MSWGGKTHFPSFSLEAFPWIGSSFPLKWWDTRGRVLSGAPGGKGRLLPGLCGHWAQACLRCMRQSVVPTYVASFHIGFCGQNLLAFSCFSQRPWRRCLAMAELNLRNLRSWYLSLSLISRDLTSSHCPALLMLCSSPWMSFLLVSTCQNSPRPGFNTQPSWELSFSSSVLSEYFLHSIIHTENTSCTGTGIFYPQYLAQSLAHNY